MKKEQDIPNVICLLNGNVMAVYHNS